MIMKKINIKYHIILPLLGLIGIVMISCERGFSDDVDLATFPNTPEVFTDVPVGLTDEFFISFDPNGGANTNGFGTDNNEAYEGSSSIRIDVPAPNDPDGGFIGGIFRDRGEGRDLTAYDALTFWAKASTTATVGLFGFGTDFIDNKYAVGLENTQLSTDWKKYVIPIPDPSKLVQEKGMFIFSAGTQSTNGFGFTFWLDEIRFERLGTLGQPRPALYGGQDQSIQANVDTDIPISGLTYTANQANGQDVTVTVAPLYFDFETSNPFVASVNDLGVVTVDGPGVDGDNMATITATLGGFNALGSLTVESTNISVTPIYSNVFGNIGGLNIGAFNNQDITIQTQLNGSDEFIAYGNLGFVGMSWDGTIDVSDMTHVHIDVQLQSPGSTLTAELIDFGPDGIDNGFGGSDGTAGGFNVTSQLVQDNWVGIDIPLTNFTLPTGGGGAGSPNLDNLGYFVLVSNNGAFLIDNIYFYSEN